jgi:hypothetical protein
MKQDVLVVEGRNKEAIVEIVLYHLIKELLGGFF